MLSRKKKYGDFYGRYQLDREKSTLMDLIWKTSYINQKKLEEQQKINLFASVRLFDKFNGLLVDKIIIDDLRNL